jgi:hypothetical protein
MNMETPPVANMLGFPRILRMLNLQRNDMKIVNSLEFYYLSEGLPLYV